MSRCVESQTNTSWSRSTALSVKSCPWGLSEGVWVFFHTLILHNSSSQLLMGDSCVHWCLGAWLGNSPPPVSLHRKACQTPARLNIGRVAGAGGHVTLMYGGRKNRGGMREGRGMRSMARRVGWYSFWSCSSTPCQASGSGSRTASFHASLSGRPPHQYYPSSRIRIWSSHSDPAERLWSAKWEALRLAAPIPAWKRMFS